MGFLGRSLLFFFFSFSCLADYEKPSHISDELWEEVTPYFLPFDHPFREKLDALFLEKRVILNKETMKTAGFSPIKARKYTHLIVTKHPNFPGIIFKIYLDAQRYYKKNPEHVYWIQRIEGATLLQSLIEDSNLAQTYKVPKKWIYPLPEFPSPPHHVLRKNFILVETDMEIVHSEKNLKLWKSQKVTPGILETLFFLLNTLELKDCAKPDNIPFSKDGTIAFVDTQTHHSPPVRFEKLTPYLSEDNQRIWKQLIQETL